MAATTKRFNLSNSKTLKMTKIIFLVIFPFILLILPKDCFDNGHYTICILKLLTNQDCIGCGMSRACMHLIHLDMHSAQYYNRLSFVVLPILSVLYLFELIKTIKSYKQL